MHELVASVIVVNWNGKHHLETCLYALERQTYPDYEIILVDNGSSDGSAEFVERNFPSVRVLRLPENKGFCGGNNIGIQQSRGEYIALINNDTEADPDWLLESVKALESHPEAGFTASRIRLLDIRGLLDTAGDLFYNTGYPGKRGWLQPDGPEYDKNAWVFGACAGAAVYRRSMLNRIGLFDEDFFNYVEDIDLSFRAQIAGYRCLYVASAIVYHKVSATIGFDNSRKQYWSHRNHWYALLKNLPAPLMRRYLGRIILAELFVLGSSIRQGRLQTYTRARLDVCLRLGKIFRKRKNVQRLRKVSNEYIHSLISDDWVTRRKDEKKRENAYLEILQSSTH